MIEVKRLYKFPTAILGEMWIDGVFFAYTLEDVYREVKVFGETCIPANKYNAIVTMSTRFKKELPLLENVPNFAGIRIHGGNTDKDTHGCILIGKNIDLKSGIIGDCAQKVLDVTKYIKDKGRVEINIIDKTF